MFEKKPNTLRSDITIKVIKSYRLRSANVALLCFFYFCAFLVFLCKFESLLTAWKILLFQIVDEKNVTPQL